ncbi:MAG: TetR family transcriptional regulator C-terminal domain-containing protein [Burkholderiales bacterium]
MAKPSKPRRSLSSAGLDAAASESAAAALPEAVPRPVAAVPQRSRKQRTQARDATRDTLVRTGLTLVLERGWSATSVDAVLAQCGVPKGSFYHYFKSKDEFGFAVLDSYQSYFLKRLNQWFGAPSDKLRLSERFAGFLADSEAGVLRYEFRRGCLIGALGQEVASLHNEFRLRLEKSLAQWDDVLARCLARSGIQGDCHLLAHAFWAGWEGAVLRAMLSHDVTPLRVAIKRFLASL